MRPYALLALACLILSAAPAAAQLKPIQIRLANQGPRTAPHRFVPFPLPDDIAGQVHEHLDSADALEPFKDLFEKIARDPKRFKLDPAAVKKLNLNDPRVQQRLKGWIDRHPTGTQPSTGDLKQLENDVKDLIRTQPADGTLPALGPAREPKDGKLPELPAPEARANDGPLRDWLKGAMERADGTQLGDWLKDSPAWQKAFVDLQTSFPAPEGVKGTWGLDKLNTRFLAPDKLPMPSAKMFEGLGNLKPPGLSRWNFSLPSLGRPTLPSVGAAPVPPASALGTIAVWLLSLALVAALTWQALRWVKIPGQAGRVSTAGLGSWPVDPRQIATRTELRQAFDYFALRVLGTQSRTWNHQAVARALTARTAGHAGAAEQLASVYELARYTEGAEALSDGERERARSALAQLGAAYA